MPNADGSVIIKTKVEVDQAEKDLRKLQDSIEKTEGEIQDLAAEKETAKKKSVFSAAELDAEKKTLAEMKQQLEEIRAVAKDKTLSVSAREEARANIPEQREAITEQQARVRLLQSEYNKIESSVDRYDEKIRKATQKLNKQKNDAGALAKRLASASKFSVKMSEAHKKAEKSMRKFNLRLREVVRSALVFTLITKALAELRKWLGNVLKTNDKTRESIARLKGALLTLAQPLVNVVIPAATVLLDALTKIVLVLADLFSRLSGSTLEQSKEAAEALNKETAALEGVGEASKDAAAGLASFDEINQLGDKNGNVDSIAPSFDFSNDKMSENADSVAGAIATIGAAFATWKISTSVLGWFDKLADGKFNNAGKVSAGLSGIAASFGLMSWHYNQLVSGDLDPNSIKSQLVSALETALGAISGVAVLHSLGVGLGVGIAITLPIVATAASLVIELSDEQGQAAVSNFKRTLEGLFSGEDWGTIVKDFVFGEEKEKTFWEKLSGVFAGTNLYNNIQNNLIDTFKNLGSEEYGEMLNMSVGERITKWMQETFPRLFDDETGKVDAKAAIKDSVGFATDPVGTWLDVLFGDKITAWLQETFPRLYKDPTAEEQAQKFMENMMDNTFAPAGWWLGSKLGDRISAWMKESFPSFFGEKDAEEKTAKSIFTLLFNAADPLTKWLLVLFRDPISAFLKGEFNNEWGNAWGTIGDTMKQKIVNALNWVIQKVNFVAGWINDVFGTKIGSIPEIQLPSSSVASGTSIPKSISFSQDYTSLMEKFFPAGGFGSTRDNTGGIGNEQQETTIIVKTYLDGKEVARNQVKHINDMTRQAGKPVLLF